MLREAAGELRNDDGEPLVDRALGTASILAALRFDPASIRAALLLPLPALPDYDPEAFAARHGADVATLVNGVARMGDIRALPAGHTPAERAAQAEHLRKMLLAHGRGRARGADQARRAHADAALPDRRRRGALPRRPARETLDLFAPLANRLGVWQLKWELEDLSLPLPRARALQAASRRLLDEKRLDRERYIARRHRASSTRELAAAGIEAEITGRPKHIYSHLEQDARQEPRLRRSSTTSAPCA